MNNPDDVLTRLRVVCPALAARLSPERTLARCGLDSIELVELLCAVEAEFGVRLQLDEISADTLLETVLATIANRARSLPPS